MFHHSCPWSQTNCHQCKGCRREIMHPWGVTVNVKNNPEQWKCILTLWDLLVRKPRIQDMLISSWKWSSSFCTSRWGLYGVEGWWEIHKQCLGSLGALKVLENERLHPGPPLLDQYANCKKSRDQPEKFILSEKLLINHIFKGLNYKWS